MRAERLLQVFEAIRREEVANPALYRIVSISPPCADISPLIAGYSYAEFLTLANGGRFGAVDLWSSESLSANQYRLESMESAGCVEIGQASYSPLVNDKSGSVFLFENERLLELASSIFDFVDIFVFGDGYDQLVGMTDDWAQSRRMFYP